MTPRHDYQVGRNLTHDEVTILVHLIAWRTGSSQPRAGHQFMSRGQPPARQASRTLCSMKPTRRIGKASCDFAATSNTSGSTFFPTKTLRAATGYAKRPTSSSPDA
jgi:hypothetical protein